MSVWFKSRLNPWYIWIPSNPNLYSTKIIVKMRWQTIASNVSIRTISPTATPLPKAYDCVAVYIAGRRTSLVVYGWWPQPPTKKYCFNSSSPGQNGCDFADDIFKRIFLNEKDWILIKISLQFIAKGSIDNSPALVQIMARRRIGDEPLCESMLTQFTDTYMRHQGEMS